MNLLDKLGRGPKREHTELDDGSWRVTVTPPAMMELPPQTLILSQGQYIRYLNWRAGNGLIQDLLHDLTKDQREVLMTGIGAEDFARMYPEEEEGEI